MLPLQASGRLHRRLLVLHHRDSGLLLRRPHRPNLPDCLMLHLQGSGPLLRRPLVLLLPVDLFSPHHPLTLPLQANGRLHQRPPAPRLRGNGHRLQLPLVLLLQASGRHLQHPPVPRLLVNGLLQHPLALLLRDNGHHFQPRQVNPLSHQHLLVLHHPDSGHNLQHLQVSRPNLRHRLELLRPVLHPRTSPISLPDLLTPHHLASGLSHQRLLARRPSLLAPLGMHHPASGGLNHQHLQAHRPNLWAPLEALLPRTNPPSLRRHPGLLRLVLPLLASLHSLQRHLVVTHPAVKPANPRNRQVALLQTLRALLPMGVVNHVSLQDHRMVLPQARLPPPMRLRGPPAPRCRQLHQDIGALTSAGIYPGVVFGAVRTTSSSTTLCHPNAGGSTGA
jgi:hypothetical protein